MRKVSRSGLLGVLALLLGVLGLTTATGPAAGAAPGAAVAPNFVQNPPAGCSERHGPLRTTPYNWQQQAQVIICKSGTNTWTLKAHISFQGVNGFANSHVVTCTAHLLLTHVGGTAADDKNHAGNCTDAAHRAAGGYSIPDETWTGVGRGTYYLTGFANVDTGNYYGGSPWASSTPQFTLA